MLEEKVNIDGVSYIYMGNGPAATGSRPGWNMGEEIYFRCPECGHMMSGSPYVNEHCPCGSLSKDADCGRFGCRVGDDAIAVYKRV